VFGRAPACGAVAARGTTAGGSGPAARRFPSAAQHDVLERVRRCCSRCAPTHAPSASRLQTACRSARDRLLRHRQHALLCEHQHLRRHGRAHPRSASSPARSLSAHPGLACASQRTLLRSASPRKRRRRCTTGTTPCTDSRSAGSCGTTTSVKSAAALRPRSSHQPRGASKTRSTLTSSATARSRSRSSSSPRRPCARCSRTSIAQRSASGRSQMPT
jgi:hypothetical protein